MNKRTLAQFIASASGLSHRDATRVVEALLRSIALALHRGERIHIRGLGVFFTSKGKARVGRMPQTGGQITIGWRKHARFKADQIIESAIQRRVAKGSPRPYVAIPVFYGTDRYRTGRKDPASFYGAGRGASLELGICEVTVPTDHRMGNLETPSIWRLEFRADSGRHVTLRTVVPLCPKEFVLTLAGHVARSNRKELFVFVHGFNVTFEDAVRRTGQLAYDLRLDAVPVCYSWPSRGSLTSAGYRHDATNIEWTLPHMEEFLNVLASRAGAGQINVIAHSMGNQVLANALAALVRKVTLRTRPTFRNIVLTAPDIDADVFRQLGRKIRPAAQRLTLYTSSNDRALLLSKKYHGDYPRAGDSGVSIVTIPGIDTIDVSAVDTSLLGHSYYAANDSILADMFYLLRHGWPPSKRFRLFPRKSSTGTYWVFRP